MSASKTQLQLSTGKRILSPSDDPSATAALVGLNQTLATVAQFQKNSEYATARLNQEESTLVSVDSVLQRIRELTLQGNNASQTRETRTSIANEMDLLIEELAGLANAKDSSNSYLYAGYQDKTQPFTQNPDGSYAYLGDEGQRFVQIADNRQIATSDSGYAVFMDILTGNGTFSVNDNSANLGTGVIDPGGLTDPQAYDGDSYTILFPVETAAVSTLTFNDAVGTDDTLTYTLKINNSVVYTANEGSTPPATLDELATVINDDTTTTGVRAYVDGGRLYLVGTAAGVETITVNESISNFTATDGDTLTGYFGSALNGDTLPSHDIVFDKPPVDKYLVVNSQQSVVASGDYVVNARINFSGLYTSIKGEPHFSDRFSIAPSDKQDMFTTLQNLSSALRSGNGANAAGRAQLSNSINRNLMNLDQAMSSVEEVRAAVGARLLSIDVHTELNADLTLNVTERKSEIEDLDFVEAISRFNREKTALQAAQQAYVQVQGLNLFSYL